MPNSRCRPAGRQCSALWDLAVLHDCFMVSLSSQGSTSLHAACLCPAKELDTPDVARRSWILAWAPFLSCCIFCRSTCSTAHANAANTRARAASVPSCNFGQYESSPCGNHNDHNGECHGELAQQLVRPQGGHCLLLWCSGTSKALDCGPPHSRRRCAPR